MAEGERLALRQEMSVSRDAFLRNLPAAVGHVPFDVRGDEFVHGDDARGWRICLESLPDRVIGGLTLVRHDVRIHLRGFDEAATREFLARFELHYRRGGG